MQAIQVGYSLAPRFLALGYIRHLRGLLPFCLQEFGRSCICRWAACACISL